MTTVFRPYYQERGEFHMHMNITLPKEINVMN